VEAAEGLAVVEFDAAVGYVQQILGMPTLNLITVYVR